MVYEEIVIVALCSGVLQGQKSRPKVDADEVFFGRIWLAASPPAAGSGERCPWVGGAPEAKRFCLILTAVDGLRLYLNLVAAGVLYE